MFLLEYIKNPRQVGAIAASSKNLANDMVNEIDFKNAACIIEYGPGTGAFTEKILARVRENTKVILIEKNESFYKILVDLYGHKDNVIILNEGVENIDKIVARHNIEKVDYIVSGLPFAAFPPELSSTILDKTIDVLGSDGEFITFQYSLFKKKLFDKFFKKIDIEKTLINLPPAYVLRCKS